MRKAGVRSTATCAPARRAAGAGRRDWLAATALDRGIFSGTRRFGGLLASAHGRLVLLVGTVTLGYATGCAAPPPGPSGAAARLYWANFSSGTIVEASLNGTHAKTIANGQHYPNAVAAGGSHLYWANGGTHPFRSGTIVEASLNGTHAKTIATGQHDPVGIAVGGSHLYWSNEGDRPFRSGTIVEANLNGTRAKTIARGQHSPDGVAVGGSRLYWASFLAGTIVGANLDGAHAKTIAKHQHAPDGLAVVPSATAPAGRPPRQARPATTD